MPQIGPQSNTFLEISFVESETKIVLSYVVREVVKEIIENNVRNLRHTGGSDSNRRRKQKLNHKIHCLRRWDEIMPTLKSLY